MTYTPNITRLQATNSTTYADLIGLQMGLPRLSGETAISYIQRISAASHLVRTHAYEGAVNEINLQLGFVPQAYIGLNLAPNTIVSVSITGVVIGNNLSLAPVPLLSFDLDTMWNWYMLSDVVNGINAITPGLATLLVTDGPAIQLARQTNSLWSLAEVVTGVQMQLQYSGIQVGSELFSQSVPSYTLSPAGLLTFSNEPLANTTITYNYVVTPYNLVGAPVALIGLADPQFQAVATTPTGALAYQVTEFIQTIMKEDLSYWAK